MFYPFLCYILENLPFSSLILPLGIDLCVAEGWAWWNMLIIQHKRLKKIHVNEISLGHIGSPYLQENKHKVTEF